MNSESTCLGRAFKLVYKISNIHMAEDLLPHEHGSHLMTGDIEEPAPMPEIDIVAPSADWQGQQIELEEGSYIGQWKFDRKEKGKYKGCKIRTYRFELIKDGETKNEKHKGEFTVHSRKSGKSIRTKIDFWLDMNENNVYEENEVMISVAKDGFRVKDALTDYTSEDYKDAVNLRRLGGNGVFQFEIEEYKFRAPILTFESQTSRQKESSFETDFGSTYNYEDLVVC